VHRSELTKSQIESFHFLLTYENSFVEYVSVKVDMARLEFVTERNDEVESGPMLINNTAEIRFDAVLTANSSTKQIAEHHGFADTKRIILSSNQYLLYQILSFSKAHLVAKKPPGFQINVYRIKTTASPTDTNTFLTPYLQSSCCSTSTQPFQFNNRLELAKSTDVLWLCRRELYLSNEVFFNARLFNALYERIRRARHLSYLGRPPGCDDGNGNGNGEDDDYDVRTFLKKVRIVVHFVAGFFRTCSLFDKTNLEVNIFVCFLQHTVFVKESLDIGE
jgi:hypothetical protein